MWHLTACLCLKTSLKQCSNCIWASLYMMLEFHDRLGLHSTRLDSAHLGWGVIITPVFFGPHTVIAATCRAFSLYKCIWRDCALYQTACFWESSKHQWNNILIAAKHSFIWYEVYIPWLKVRVAFVRAGLEWWIFSLTWLVVWKLLNPEGWLFTLTCLVVSEIIESNTSRSCWKYLLNMYNSIIWSRDTNPFYYY